MENVKSANSSDRLSTVFEIKKLASQLNHKNQAYILNTINALLFAQQSTEENSDGSREVG